MLKKQVDIEKLKAIDWQYLVNRREALLFLSIVNNCYRDFKKITGIPWQVKLIFHRSDGDLLFSAKTLNELRQIFLKSKVKLLIDFRRRLIFYVKNLNRVASEIEKTDCSKLTRAQLIKLLDNFLKSAHNAHKFLTPLAAADNVISKKILDLLPDAPEEEKQNWLNILVYPTKENQHIKEERSFYNLVKSYKNKGMDLAIKRHLNKFGWIGARWYWWDQAWKKSDIERRLADFLAQKKDPDKETKNLDNMKKEKAAETKELIRRFKIRKSSLLHKSILIAKEYAYLRTWRTDIIYRAGYKVRGLFYEIARRAGLKENDVVHLTFTEIRKMAKSEKLPISIKEIKRRKEYFIIILLGNKYMVLSGKSWQKKLKNVGIQKEKVGKQIKGICAFSGKAKGVVKVVYSGKNMEKVKQGDILVAVMTFPNLVSAMERAAAFVTDEGGILCHAAIVSREMKKPCIIGTKIATKVLKDGDLVEVDAEKGIVRILKRTK